MGTIPGLLQTGDYAREFIRTTAMSDGVQAKVDALVEVRLARQAVLPRERPVDLWATLAEAALRVRVKDQGVMREQLSHHPTARPSPEGRAVSRRASPLPLVPPRIKPLPPPLPAPGVGSRYTRLICGNLSRSRRSARSQAHSISAAVAVSRKSILAAARASSGPCMRVVSSRTAWIWSTARSSAWMASRTGAGRGGRGGVRRWSGPGPRRRRRGGGR
ncbi:Scr1 family TA system antitoxin-like transcriptional regulator [Actinomadura keratinilytica]